MPTLNDLARRVMLEQGVLERGEQPSAQEAADMVAAMTSIHAELMDLGELDWPLESIPVRCENAWLVFVAGETARWFGLGMDPELKQASKDARRRLRAQSAQPEDPRDKPVTDY